MEFMKILALTTGLFPDRDTVEAALTALAASHEVTRGEVSAATNAAQWDRVVAEILRADVVVTT